MKKNKSKIKVICALLVAVMLLSALSSAGASGSFVIDDSAFSSYEVDHMTVYYWRPGIPPTTKDGSKYPVLITWDNGKYYFATGADFFNKEKTYTDLRSNNSDLPMYGYDHPDLDIRYMNGWYPKMWVGSGGWLGGHVDYGKLGRRFPRGYYRYVCSYPCTASDGLTAKLPFDFNTLDEQGRMVSLEKPNVPFLAGQKTVAEGLVERNYYLMGVDVPESLRSGNRYYNSNYQYALLMMHLGWDDYNNKDFSDAADALIAGDIKTYFNWHLKPIFTNTVTGLGDLTADTSTMTESQINDFYNKIYDPSRGDSTVTLPNNLLWQFYRRSSGGFQYPDYVYEIYTQADWAWNQHDDPTWYDTEPYLNFMGAISARVETRLQSSGSIIQTQGNINDADYSNEDRLRFKIYYATPVLMDIIQTSFEVENGQVANLDGPIIIGNNCTITVKEGGTLTITAKSEANGVDLGWVMNNGKIKIEKGGTLYIQKGACINKYNNKNNAGGGIICEGLVIVDEDAKLCGGGVDGIQFKNGSHVINYGAIISENFTIEKDHTIENRGSKAVVFHGKGNGVTGSGYGLFTGEVTSSGFPERGTVLDTVTDNVNSVANGIYTW